MKISTLRRQYRNALFSELALDMYQHFYFELADEFTLPDAKIERKAKIQAMLIARKQGQVLLYNLINNLQN